MPKGLKSLLLAGAVSFAVAFPTVAIAQDTPDDDDDLYQEIIVTGAFRQGGAQDISHFRSVSLDGEFLPPSDSLTVEGLLGEHDLTLPRREACKQMFCLVGHSMAADLPLRPQDAYFVGLDFDSNIDVEKRRAEPISVIAVVDRSGSMSGAPIAKVKEALRSVLSQLGKNDRMGIVIYGTDTEVRLPVTDVASQRSAIQRAISSIDINGSTYLEAGLKLGYETAFDELARSKGKTRLMLFTDEQPNVGDTSAEGFMGLARAGSERGVGLTTIGVGVHYDGELASKVASARGGNLFFIDAATNPDAIFGRDFRNMTSEVAHDIVMSMTPPPGYKITGVFGVPAETMTETAEGTITVTVGSAFLSSNGGGIYVSLGRDAAREHLPLAPLEGSMLDVQLSYVDAVTGVTGSDRIAVPQPAPAAPEGLRAAMALVDEYLSLQQALDAYHDDGDEKAAFALLDNLSSRIDGLGLKGFDGERELVGGLRDRAAYMSGYAGEMPKELRPMAVVGEWQVTYFKGVGDIARGDRVELNEYGEFITYPRDEEKDEIYQDFEVNERQLRIVDEEDMLFRYRLHGDRLTLRSPNGEAQISLQRIQ